jgi:hypothetical protein
MYNFFVSITNIGTNIQNSNLKNFDPFGTPISSSNNPLSIVKYKGLFSFDASRDDELSIKVGDVITVDMGIKTDDGWLWGECQGRTGVFPAGYADKLTDLE